MQAMNIRIETKAPVVLSTHSHASVMTATNDFFSGSTLRGILAARFIEKRRLGAAAHEDADFMRLFYGELRFVDAYPIDPVTGRRAIVLPFSMQRSKDGREIKDLLQRNAELAPGFKGMKGFGAVHDGTVRCVAVQRGITLHMSRTDLKDGSGMERLAGRSRSGGIYNYEAIAAEQTFEGTVYGTAETLTLLRGSLDASFSCCAGRSKYTQYGACEVTLMEPQDIPTLPALQGTRICIRLETPLIPWGGVPGDAASMLAEVTAALNAGTSGGFSIAEEPRSIFAKAEEIDNFVGTWGMRRPRETALAAGTVFAVKKSGAWADSDAAALHALFHDGVGRRREEGFGQLRLWDSAALCRADDADSGAREERIICPAAKEIAKKILVDHIVEQVRIRAAMDAETARIPSGARHALARLDHELGLECDNAIGAMRGFAGQMREKKNTPLAEMMRNIVIGRKSLAQYFDDIRIEDMPYYSEEQNAVRKDDTLTGAAEAIDLPDGSDGLLRTDRIFYAYWHAFFRFAGKRAGRREEGGDRV